MPKTKPFAKESDLCAAFIAAIGPNWTAYAETAGWDILLVRNADGFQIGVQAKLKLNPFVLAQCLEGSMHQVESCRPDAIAILVPWAECQLGLTFLCAYIGITVIRAESPISSRLERYVSRRIPFDPELPELGREWKERHWYEQCPTKRCKLPEYVPDVAAGSASPLQLTEWKIGALKVAVLLEQRGFITRSDFRAIGIDHRRWIARDTGWLVARNGRYVQGPRLPKFKEQHPVVFEKIKADAAKWMPKQDVLL